MVQCAFISLIVLLTLQASCAALSVHHPMDTSRATVALSSLQLPLAATHHTSSRDHVFVLARTMVHGVDSQPTAHVSCLAYFIIVQEDHLLTSLIWQLSCKYQLLPDSCTLCNNYTSDFLIFFLSVNTPTCPAGSLPCLTNQKCYLATRECDGVKDCIDGSDESHCNTTAKGMFCCHTISISSTKSQSDVEC